MSVSTNAQPAVQRPATQPAMHAGSESQRGFWALIATQFQGAFSDNVLRYLLLGIVVGTGISEESGNRLVSVTASGEALNDGGASQEEMTFDPSTNVNSCRQNLATAKTPQTVEIAIGCREN